MRRGPGQIYYHGVWYDKDDLRRQSEDRVVSAPYVIDDEMTALEHPATGKMCSSKSEFRKMTRGAGCIEVGNERIERPKAYEPDAHALTDLVIRQYDELERRERR